MVVNYNFKINPKDKRTIELLLSNMKTKLPMFMDVAIHNYAGSVVKSLRREVTMKAAVRGGSPRTKLASEIRADKLKRFSYGVFIPQRGVYLDSMPSHYVSLNKRRLINRWVQKYYTGKKVSGKSRIYHGKFGQIRGGLYVTPDPFIDEGTEKVNHVLDDEIKLALEKTFGVI